jgi:hypothetical protein
MRNIIREINLIFFAAMIVLLSCSNSSDSNETFTLSGTLEKSDVSDGIHAYMKLVNRNDDMNAKALYSTSASFSSGNASYSKNGIEEGEYTLYAFIDMNRNAAGDEDSLPDAGDYVTDTDVVIDSDMILSPSESDWDVY